MLDEHPILRCRNFGINLVRGDLNDGVVGGDMLTLFNHPSNDGCLGHALAHFW